MCEGHCRSVDKVPTASRASNSSLKHRESHAPRTSRSVRSSAAGNSANNIQNDGLSVTGKLEQARLRHKASEASNTSAGTNSSRWPWPLRRTNTNASNLAGASNAVDTWDFEASKRAKTDEIIAELDRKFLTADDRKMLRNIKRLYRSTVRHHRASSSHSSEDSSRADDSSTPSTSQDRGHRSRSSHLEPQPATEQGTLSAFQPARTAAQVPRGSSASLPALRLRGGGLRTTLPSPPLRMRHPDDARVDAITWWFAGGRKSRHGRFPTVGELRVRKEVEQANRAKVGFFGTLLGIRKVGRVTLKDEDIAKFEEVANGLIGTVE